MNRKTLKKNRIKRIKKIETVQWIAIALSGISIVLSLAKMQ